MTSDLMSRLADWLYASRICAFTLGGQVPKQLRGLSPLPDLGDTERGRKILGGTLVCTEAELRKSRTKLSTELAIMNNLYDYNIRLASTSDLQAAGCRVQR